MWHLLLAAPAAAYQLLSLFASLRFLARTEPVADTLPPVSILKPLHGVDDQLYSAIRSHVVQTYPAPFELLFGVRDPQDAAVPYVERLRQEFPGLAIRLLVTEETAPNGKVGVLMGLAKQARYPVVLVNDSDITVPPDYLRRVVSALADPGVGLVTCLYRASASTPAARWEALSISTDFAPSVLVAPLVGVTEFALGSTLCLRAADLERIGGFGAIADYLADDYQLGKRISGLGLRNHLSTLAVETRVGGQTWGDVWAHQVRWARTLRVCKGLGYLGIPLTLAGVWALLLLLLGDWPWAAALLCLRSASAFVAGSLALRDPAVLKQLWLVPLRDCAALAVWAAGQKSGAVVWRNKVLNLTPDGRIV